MRTRNRTMTICDEDARAMANSGLDASHPAAGTVVWLEHPARARAPAG